MSEEIKNTNEIVDLDDFVAAQIGDIFDNKELIDIAYPIFNSSFDSFYRRFTYPEIDRELNAKMCYLKAGIVVIYVYYIKPVIEYFDAMNPLELADKSCLLKEDDEFDDILPYLSMQEFYNALTKLNESWKDIVIHQIKNQSAKTIDSLRTLVNFYSVKSRYEFVKIIEDNDCDINRAFKIAAKMLFLKHWFDITIEALSLLSKDESKMNKLEMDITRHLKYNQILHKYNSAEELLKSGIVLYQHDALVKIVDFYEDTIKSAVEFSRSCNDIVKIATDIIAVSLCDRFERISAFFNEETNGEDEDRYLSSSLISMMLKNYLKCEEDGDNDPQKSEDWPFNKQIETLHNVLNLIGGALR